MAVISVTWMAFMGVFFLFPTTPKVKVGEDMNYTVVVLGGVLILSLVYYYFLKYGELLVHWTHLNGRRDRSIPLGVGTDKEKGSPMVEIIRIVQIYCSICTMRPLQHWATLP